MKNILALAAALASTLAALPASPCGMPFGVGINVDPRQDIIVVHKNGVETYVFQPTFCGTASNFGLILPVPSKLTEQPALANAGIFAYVDSLSQPRHVALTACRSRGPVDGGMAAGSAGNGGQGTTVVASGRVGFLDWAQLKADSTASFTDWLDANGYPHQASTNTAFAYYVDKGWYFLAFKIAQTATANYVCNALGPVKLSFTSDVPVVPSGMASAGAASTTSGSYSPGFTWRIFGISEGASQIGFAPAANNNRTFNYSGQLTANDVTQLDGLAAENDRLTKLSLWFGSGGFAEDVALSLQAAKDYREIVYDTTYVDCIDAGTPVDASPDVVSVDGRPQVDLVPQKPLPDGGVDTQPTLGPVADARSASQDAVPIGPRPNVGGGGACSITPAGAPAGWSAGMAMPLLLGLALLWRVRRRKD